MSVLGTQIEALYNGGVGVESFVTDSPNERSYSVLVDLTGSDGRPFDIGFIAYMPRDQNGDTEPEETYEVYVFVGETDTNDVRRVLKKLRLTGDTIDDESDDSRRVIRVEDVSAQNTGETNRDVLSTHVNNLIAIAEGDLAPIS